MTIKTDILPDPLPDTFDALSTLHQLRPIRDEIDYDNAVRIVDQLAVLNIRTQDQEDYLETLAESIGKYDDEHYAVDLEHLEPVDSLRFLMEKSGVSLAQLGDILGGQALAKKVLNGEQELDKEQVRILSVRFKVNPGLFL